MKKTIYIISLFVIAALFSACEEVIVLDLKTNEPRIVIEADLNGTDGELVVKCSQTVGFYSDSAFNPVSDAIVTLENGKDGAFVIDEDEPGIYRLSGYDVLPGEEYKILINIDEILYEATATAPIPAELLEIAVEEVEIPGPPPEITFYSIIGGWLDTPDVKSFYCVRLVVNDQLPGERILVNDEEQDGELLFVNTITSELVPGDEVSVQLSAINEAVYDYFQQVDDMRSNGFSAAAPYNPKGNFTNDALGYFSVCYTNKKKAVAQ